MGPSVLRITFILILAIVVLLSGIVPVNAKQAKGEASRAGELDEILKGFDAHPDNEGKDDGLEDVLEGFEDDPEPAGDKEGLDDVLKGFEDESDDGKPLQKEEAEKVRPLELTGSMSLGLSYAYAHEDPKPGEPDYEGLTRVRPDIHLELDYRLPGGWKALISGRAFFDFAYRLNDRDQFEREVLDTYEQETELGEVYLQGALLENMDLKVGRQIVVWGRSDNIRVVDILNPLDLREPGLVDIEDLRLPVTMTKLDYYLGKWNLSGIAVHEIRFPKGPVFGSEFFSLDARLPLEEEPANTFDNTEYGFTLNGIFSGWDLSLYYARFFDDRAHLEGISIMESERRHSRLSMVGTAVNLALGNWLLKSETAWFEGLEFFALPDEEMSRWDLLLGVEYSGFRDTVISLEAVNHHLKDFKTVLEIGPDSTRQDEFQGVLRISGDYLHDKLHTVLLLSFYGLDWEEGALQRFSVGYDVTDAFNVTLGIVTYQSGDRAELSRIGDKDRLFLEAKYSF